MLYLRNLIENYLADGKTEELFFWIDKGKIANLIGLSVGSIDSHTVILKFLRICRKRLRQLKEATGCRVLSLPSLFCTCLS